MKLTPFPRHIPPPPPPHPHHPPPLIKKCIFKGSSGTARKVSKRWTIDFKHVKWSMILFDICTEIYFNLTNKYHLLIFLALWLVGYFPYHCLSLSAFIKKTSKAMASSSGISRFADLVSVNEFPEGQGNENNRKITKENIALLKDFLTLKNESRAQKKFCLTKSIHSVRHSRMRRQRKL